MDGALRHSATSTHFANFTDYLPLTKNNGAQCPPKHKRPPVTKNTRQFLKSSKNNARARTRIEAPCFMGVLWLFFAHQVRHFCQKFKISLSILYKMHQFVQNGLVFCTKFNPQLRNLPQTIPHKTRLKYFIIYYLIEIYKKAVKKG